MSVAVPARRLSYNTALDGLRALAVTAVVVQHAGFQEGGYFGVTVFFVISGYLITGLLLAEHSTTGAIALTAFYRRRVARLAPALLVVTAVITIWLLATAAPIGDWWAGLVGTLTYTTDLLLATPAAAHVSTSFEWSWSLGIEEQFYLVWPILMIWLLRRGSGRSWLAVLAAAAVFAVIHQPWQTMKLTTRDLGGYGQVALLCAVLVAGVVIASDGLFARVLALPPLVHVGRLSYGVYLWNQLLAEVCQRITGHLPSRTGAGLIAWAVALLVVAELSYRFVETPLRQRWSRRPASATERGRRLGVAG